MIFYMSPGIRTRMPGLMFNKITTYGHKFNLTIAVYLGVGYIYVAV